MTLDTLLGLLFPPTCILCGAPGADGRDLCAGCAAELPLNRHCCARCALPFGGAMPVGTLCGACQRRPPPFDASVAALRYESPVTHLVTAAKFRGRLNAARLLGQLLADAVRQAGAALPTVLVPVPLHRVREIERGYNQALEIARVVGRELDLPLAPDCCQRVTATRPQSGLDEPARRRNIRGAFAVPEPLEWPRAALVDDVVTTGSTVSELARMLRRAGVAQVSVWAAARTP